MKRYITFGLFLLLFLALAWYAYSYLPVDVAWYRGLDIYAQVGLDWKECLRPAALFALNGINPYDEPGFFNPPWVLLPLLPLAPLPAELSSAILFGANWAAFIYVAYRLRMRLFWIACFATTSGVSINSYFGNIDGLAALGLVMPPQVGLFFILTKPQIGLPVALYWLVEAWRRGGLRECIRVFAPVTAAGLLSLALFGLWPLKSSYLVGIWWNTSVWPRGVLLGLLMLAASLRWRRLPLAAACGPYLSPFVSLQSWAFVYLGLLALLPGPVDVLRWAVTRSSHSVIQSRRTQSIPALTGIVAPP